MWFLYLFFVLFLLYCFPYLRYMVFHPVLSIRYGFIDIYDHYKYKRQNECPEYGHIKMFTAADAQAFGSGKTLSMVRYVRNIYHKYNDKPVWDEETKSFVNQKIIIISNIEFKDYPNIPT